MTVKKRAVEQYKKQFDTKGAYRLFSAPGRIEIGGNHTDHQNGNILAAAIDLEVAGAAASTDTALITIVSEDYPLFQLPIHETAPVASEQETSVAFVRGILAGITALGYSPVGLNISVASDVLPGSGLSSSAAFSLLIATIMNAFFAAGEIAPMALAQICKAAENDYFGKPSGLMDQAVCSLGGIVQIDFAEPTAPKVHTLSYDFSKKAYSIYVINTGSSHANLTDAYAAIPYEMGEIASHFGASTLHTLTDEMLFAHAPLLREKFGDRAFLRAHHFFAETKRPAAMAAALLADDLPQFLALVSASGASSFQYLQNIYLENDVQQQSLSVALACAESILKDAGAWRVHGGGFAGTILCFVPQCKDDLFIKRMKALFGAQCLSKLNIRSYGAREERITSL